MTHHCQLQLKVVELPTAETVFLFWRTNIEITRVILFEMIIKATKDLNHGW